MKFINDYSLYNVILWKRDGSFVRYQLFFLSLDFLDIVDDYDYVLFLKFDFPSDISDPNINDLMARLQNLYDYKGTGLFIILTNRREAPIYNERVDEYVYSFSCEFSIFKDLIRRISRKSFQQNHFLFDLLDYMLIEQTKINQIIVRQLPLGTEERITTNSCNVIIPHKGENSYLVGLLYFLKKINLINIFIGLDQPVDDLLAQYNDANDDTNLFSFNPNPVGPYVIRNKLIEESEGDLMFFQDSDDIPCADRFDRISDYMITTGCELCGSHELKMDYYSKTVIAIRYPIDVKSSLEVTPGHSLLHPSSAITREAFYLCDRLSEERIFANDTKFLYHSFFRLHTIQNFDEFLYIRRVRPGSLTTMPGIQLGSPARRWLLSEFNKDFNLIKSGKLKIEQSSLRYVGPRFKYTARKL
jgi:hypothetical protein